jgi:hypothetical protein
MVGVQPAPRPSGIGSRSIAEWIRCLYVQAPRADAAPFVRNTVSLPGNRSAATSGAPARLTRSLAQRSTPSRRSIIRNPSTRPPKHSRKPTRWTVLTRWRTPTRQTARLPGHTGIAITDADLDPRSASSCPTPGQTRRPLQLSAPDERSDTPQLPEGRSRRCGTRFVNTRCLVTRTPRRLVGGMCSERPG